MNNTRALICDTATKMFNEKGYHAVSLRDIAKEAGTTIGNLTYHFKKKEDLVAAMVSELQDDFSLYFSTGLTGKDLLLDILNSFKKAEENRKRYSFYYNNLNELAAVSENLMRKNQMFQKKLYDYYLLSLRVLQGEGLVKETVDKVSLHLLACTLVNISGSWGTLASPYSNTLINTRSYSETCCDMLSVFLSADYLPAVEEWKKIADVSD